MKLTYIGHAKALVEAGGVRLITDPSFSEPLYCNTLWHYPPLAIGLEQLPPLDFIYVSHHHRDHFDPASLQRLNRSAALIIPALDDGWGPLNATGERDRFHGAIKRLGFRTVHVLRAWESLQIAPDVTVTMVPAQTLEPDSSLVLQAGGQTLFAQNDNYLGDTVRAELARRFPRIDVGLMFWGATVGYPATAELPEAEKIREARRRREDHFFAMARANLEILRPRLFVPFANDLAWLAPQEVWINRLCKMHVGHLLEYLQRHPVPGVTPMPMNSGDWWTPDTGLHRLQPEPDWASFFDELEHYAARMAPALEPIFARERAIDTAGLRALWSQRMTETCAATRGIIQQIGRVTVHFRVQGAGAQDFPLAFADGRFVVGTTAPPHGSDLRLTVDDFLLMRALLGELEFQEIRNTRWRISHPQGYTDAIRRFYMWLFVHADNFIAERWGAQAGTASVRRDSAAARPESARSAVA